jgi:hypothetical protein
MRKTIEAALRYLQGIKLFGSPDFVAIEEKYKSEIVSALTNPVDMVLKEMNLKNRQGQEMTAMMLAEIYNKAKYGGLHNEDTYPMRQYLGELQKQIRKHFYNQLGGKNDNSPEDFKVFEKADSKVALLFENMEQLISLGLIK